MKIRCGSLPKKGCSGLWEAAGCLSLCPQAGQCLSSRSLSCAVEPVDSTSEGWCEG